MLTIKIAGTQSWDPQKAEFRYGEPVELKLEHSLLSLANWESKWHIPFLSNVGNLDGSAADGLYPLHDRDEGG